MGRKRKVLTILFFLLIVLISAFVYNHFFTKKMIVGDYINSNYNYEHFLADVPYSQDTLKLYANNQFTSGYYGKGSYRLEHSFKGTSLELIYQSGTASSVMSINRKNFTGVALMISTDNDHYYLQLIK